MRQPREPIPVDALEVGEISGDDLHQVVGLACQQMALKHLIKNGDGGLKCALMLHALAVERRLDEKHHREASALPVKPRHVPVDQAIGLQLLNPTMTGRRRQAGALRQLCDGPPRVHLEFAEEPTVSGIKAVGRHLHFQDYIGI